MLFIFIFKNINYATLLYVAVHINKLGDSGALRARALHAPVFLGSLTRKTGRYPPPPPAHGSFAAILTLFILWRDLSKVFSIKYLENPRPGSNPCSEWWPRLVANTLFEEIARSWKKVHSELHMPGESKFGGKSANQKVKQCSSKNDRVPPMVRVNEDSLMLIIDVTSRCHWLMSWRKWVFLENAVIRKHLARNFLFECCNYYGGRWFNWPSVSTSGHETDPSITDMLPPPPPSRPSVKGQWAPEAPYDDLRFQDFIFD